MKKNKLTWGEWAFVLFCFLFYLSWSLVQPYTYGPDEEMRFQIREFIYLYGSLPNGFYERLISPNWGFSYAFYPCWLGPLCSALFMKITSIFSQDFFHLLCAARFTSVISGALTVYFAMKSGKLLFKGPGRWIFPGLIGMLPQFAFLSSYVNNDVIAIMGSSVIFYGWCLGKEEWNIKNCLILAGGVIIVALSYYNAYGWILGSMILFIFNFLWESGKNKGMAVMWKRAGFTAVIVLLFISFFFIRNAVLYEGDILGMSTLTKAGEMYGIPQLKPSMRRTPYNLGMTLGEMMESVDFTGRPWYKMTYESLIGVFGCMNVFAGPFTYRVYTVIFILGLAGLLVSVFVRKRDRHQWVFEAVLLLCFVIPILLSIYYSYYTDYQAQGRYCATMLVALMYFTAFGMETLLEGAGRLVGKRLENLAGAVFLAGLIGLSLKIYFLTYLPSVKI